MSTAPRDDFGLTDRQTVAHFMAWRDHAVHDDERRAVTRAVAEFLRAEPEATDAPDFTWPSLVAYLRFSSKL